MTTAVWGIIADDNTGATDAAGMLTERGVPTVLFTTSQAAAAPPPQARNAGAIVVGTQNRSVPPAEAADTTRQAIRALHQLGIQKFQIKYCSTFDSTPQGNIGPTLDAAMDEIGVPGTVVCPALPVNGRTVYQGHLFVGHQLLSESPLRNHPLNPMTDANLVRWLGRQTTRRVGLVDLTVVRRGPDALRTAYDALLADGYAYLVTDAVADSDLEIIVRATADWPLLSGGSGLTAALPEIHYPSRQPLVYAERLATVPPSTLVVSGSQSPMSRRQAAAALDAGFAGIRLDVPSLLRGEFSPDSIIAPAQRFLAAGGAVLIYAPADEAEGVQKAQTIGAALGLSEVETGERIAVALAQVAARLVADGVVGRLVISGGETSGVVCRELGFTAFEIGLPLAPGVPYCFPQDGRPLLVVLKSGNFGSESLYTQVRALGSR